MEISFSPSELVLFHGERFAEKEGRGDNFSLLHLPQAVSVRQLAGTLLLAAFLGNEQSGALNFRTGVQTGFLGLSKSRVLFVEPTGVRELWPAHSLEAGILEIAEKVPKGVGMLTLIQTLLQGERSNPGAGVIDRVQAGMARRGLLTPYEEKVNQKKVTRYALSTTTMGMATGQTIGHIQQWILTSEQERPELHRMLLDGIEQGLGS